MPMRTDSASRMSVIVRHPRPSREPPAPRSTQAHRSSIAYLASQLYSRLGATSTPRLCDPSRGGHDRTRTAEASQPLSDYEQGGRHQFDRQRKTETSGLYSLNKDWIPERGARLARRDDREYGVYLREEQRRQPPLDTSHMAARRAAIGGGIQSALMPRSPRITWAALYPGSPVTLPPGWLLDPHK
jgi:hypothetical protein